MKKTKIFILSLIIICSSLFSTSFSVNTVQAFTAEEIEILIAILDLTPAQTATLRSLVASDSVCYNFTRTLKNGDTGPDVDALYKIMSKEGISTGQGITNAVSKLQEKYQTEVLRPFGLTKGTGFFGLTTRTLLNNKYKCSTSNPIVKTPVTQSTTTAPVVKKPVTTHATSSALISTKTNPYPFFDILNRSADADKINGLFIEFKIDADVTVKNKEFVSSTGYDMSALNKIIKEKKLTISKYEMDAKEEFIKYVNNADMNKYLDNSYYLFSNDTDKTHIGTIGKTIESLDVIDLISFSFNNL